MRFAAEAPVEETGITRTGLAVLSVMVVLILILGFMTVGFIPTLGSHGGKTVTSTARGQFITITSTAQGSTATTTVTGPGGGTGPTVTSTTTVSAVVAELTTTTLTSSSTTTTTTTTTTTALSTTTATTTTTVTENGTGTSPEAPISISVNSSIANPGVTYAGNIFKIQVTIQSSLPNANVTLDAYQVLGQGIPVVVSFFPPLPELVQPVVGTSTYVIEGTFNQNAPAGSYQMYVVANAASSIGQNGGIETVASSTQYIFSVQEPISITGYSLTNTTSFGGACKPIVFAESGVATWTWQCGMDAAPMAQQNVTFAISNAADVPICLQAALGASGMTAFVSNSPYPFCPNGESGVLVPAGSTSWPVEFLVTNGTTAGNQTVFFTFMREGS